ncbi:Rv1476 family membrane protein [Corynebacterium sp. S7]
MNYDPQSLAEQLRQDGVAFGSDNINNWALEESLFGTLDQMAGLNLPDIGVVVLEDVSQSSAQLRDLAQDMNLATGIDTVVVRTPNSVAVASDTLNRAEIENAQQALMGEPDYATGLYAFAESVAGFNIPWAAVSLVAVLAIAVVIVATAYFARRR